MPARKTTKELSIKMYTSQYTELYHISMCDLGDVPTTKQQIISGRNEIPHMSERSYKKD